MKPLLLLSLLAATALPLSAQRTTARGLRPAEIPAAPSEVPALDTLSLTADTASIRFYGYEKTLRATKETLFLQNNAPREAAEVRFTILYLDSAGREIHRRRIVRRVAVPSGKTVRLDLPSWDTQKTFYYSGGPRPRVSATPYSVKIRPETLILLR